jgi:2,4-dienoyl-CoA reductase-like NADH-dependent reductase (Old Yellow Enzyme family)
MSQLFSPFRLRGLEMRNRIAVSPMCQYSSEDGVANDWHMVHLGSRAVGGAGLVLVEATAVVPEGRISPGDLGLWDDGQIEPLRRIREFLNRQGAVAGVQLAHAGRKASTAVPWEGGAPILPDAGGWIPDAPSALPFAPGFATPNELDGRGILTLVQAFGAAARRALQAGFQTVEIHGAHGYLIHEFLSPLSNRRTDGYGGSFENRTRFLREVIAAVRREWPDSMPVLLRVSATDWMGDEGWTADDTVALARMVAPLGVDLIDCSSGGNVAQASRIPLGPGYQVEFAARVKREAGVASGAVGMITAPEQAEAVIANGEADVVFLARAFLRNPYWALEAAMRLGVSGAIPPQYLRAFPR